MTAVPAAASNHHRRSPTDHAFHGADVGSAGEASLISPPLVVSAAANLVVSFDHAYSFEAPAFDGGVIEISGDSTRPMREKLLTKSG